ncbi:hypothetical protein DPMN_064286 [Dreissena polymorpha]|uniref:Uncharacterized protein n=1 Tax=Dreissena polymorpha TaxID=45954 RepID=A0A9D4CDB6_DREPO|nr:hypothetical protein DPMN_064286 [Dreissena polymorpha]
MNFRFIETNYVTLPHSRMWFVYDIVRRPASSRRLGTRLVSPASPRLANLLSICIQVSAQGVSRPLERSQEIMRTRNNIRTDHPTIFEGE